MRWKVTFSASSRFRRGEWASLALYDHPLDYFRLWIRHARWHRHDGIILTRSLRLAWKSLCMYARILLRGRLQNYSRMLILLHFLGSRITDWSFLVYLFFLIASTILLRSVDHIDSIKLASMRLTGPCISLWLRRKSMFISFCPSTSIMLAWNVHLLLRLNFYWRSELAALTRYLHFLLSSLHPCSDFIIRLYSLLAIALEVSAAELRCHLFIVVLNII